MCRCAAACAISCSVLVQGFMRAPPQPAGGGHVLFDHFWVALGDRPLPEDGVHADGEIALSSIISRMLCLLKLSNAALERHSLKVLSFKDIAPHCNVRRSWGCD